MPNGKTSVLLGPGICLTFVLLSLYSCRSRDRGPYPDPTLQPGISMPNGKTSVLLGLRARATMTFLGRSANGRFEWKTAGGQTLKDVQAAQSEGGADGP